MEKRIYTAEDFGQGDLAWKMIRTGKITSSNVYNLFSKPRKAEQGEPFGEIGKSYLFDVASGKNLKDVYKDEHLFEDYLNRIDCTTKEMRYESENELLARCIYAKKIGASYTYVEDGEEKKMEGENFILKEYSFVECLGEYDGYGDSPDGVICDNGGTPIGCLEIKCPKPATYLKYRYQFEQGLTLKDIEPKYYYQCLSHCLANDVKWCDFVIFDKMQKNGFFVKRIEPNDWDIEELKGMILIGLNYINRILKNLV